MVRSVRSRALRVFGVLAAFLLLPSVAQADDVPDYDFASPLFGLATMPDGALAVADTGAGVVELRKGTGTKVIDLPGVVDVAPIGRRSLHAVSGGEEGMLYRITGTTAWPMADIAGYEAEVNPAGGPVESNAFDVARAPGGAALVADAAGNSLLRVSETGRVNWVAAFPNELVSTANAKALAGCPDAPDEFAFVCELPAMIPAEPVATSVTIGPDGAYYVGELKGFPAPTGASRIWRIERGTRHAQCGTDPRCSVVADGFTSIIDLNTGPDGTVYVTEFDEASWLAAELGLGTGGTVSACHMPAGHCQEVATGLPLPTATTAARGHLFTTIWSLVPGQARVAKIA